jgi:hypothetical protein
MNFKEYLEYRSDEEDEIGVIATDLLEEELIPFDSKDGILLTVIDNSFKDTEVYGNWTKLKKEYVSQKDRN